MAREMESETLLAQYEAELRTLHAAGGYFSASANTKTAVAVARSEILRRMSFAPGAEAELDQTEEAPRVPLLSEGSNPPLTVMQVMKRLNEMPVYAEVPGLDLDSASYRGYYERLAISPGPGVKAHDLFIHLSGKLGTDMEGWKGGHFMITENTLVHVAYEGDTGPKLVDFDGVVPVLEDEVW